MNHARHASACAIGFRGMQLCKASTGPWVECPHTCWAEHAQHGGTVFLGHPHPFAFLKLNHEAAASSEAA